MDCNKISRYNKIESWHSSALPQLLRVCSSFCPLNRHAVKLNQTEATVMGFWMTADERIVLYEYVEGVTAV